MNRTALIVLAVATAMASSAALAQHHGKQDGRHEGMHEGRQHQMRGGIASLDADADGRIARSEIAGKDRMAAMFEKNFDVIDANRDGYIVRTEMRAFHERQKPMHEAQRNKRVEERYVAADLNGDGKLSKVEVAEKMPRMAKRFAWMDDNRDGFLSRAELRSDR